MARKPVTAKAFADELQAAGVRVVWRDTTEFEALHGKGASARSATVSFFRDTSTFSHARSGGGAPLRSMSAVYRHLRLATGRFDPANKTATDLAADLARGGATITWHADTFRNFTAERHGVVVHVHCHEGKDGNGGVFNYGRGENGIVFESMAAVKQHLGLRKTSAFLFAADLARAGAVIRWRDAAQFQAVHIDGGAEYAVTVLYNPKGRLRFGTAGIGVHLYTKADIRRHLRLPDAA